MLKNSHYRTFKKVKTSKLTSQFINHKLEIQITI